MEPPRPTRSDRSFWFVFALAWLAYGGLFGSAAVVEGVAPLDALLLAVGSTLASALPAAVLGAERRRLLQPEWSLLRTVGVHLLAGAGYALTAAALATLLVWGMTPLDIESPWSESGPAVFGVRVVNGLFLYLVLAGFLMWTESRRRVEESRALADREAVLRARAEARALRAQFNPHFVFNTLHSLMLLVRADPPAAERAIEDVAALIRYASVLQRREIDAVPLREEMEIAGRYLALEKLRLAERLDVTWSVPGDLLPCAVPAFSLQTLLENAVKHGVSPRPGGGAIHVEASVRDGRLRLAVADDGEGADPAGVASAEGRGLDLLARRLEMLHGEGGRLEWETAPGRGFRAVIDVPSVPAGSSVMPRGPEAA